jgi:predicted Zn-dependent protease
MNTARKDLLNCTSLLYFICCLMGIICMPLLPAWAVEPEVLAKKALCHSCLAKIYVAERRYPEAIVEYQALLAMKPNDAAMRFEYGNLLAKIDKAALAVPQFRAAAKLAPYVPEYQVGLGNACMYTKNYDGAVTAYTKACNLGGKYQTSLQTALQYQAQQKSLNQYTQQQKQEVHDQDDE